ncbi:MAG TPA: hypothetical protein VHY20_06070, partial [Pirellulales bacterium]|nr:hypothetical protein [Pirellulales bacterium]
MADEGKQNGVWDIDALVRDVLARLAASGNMAPSEVQPAENTPTATNINPLERVLSDRVITLSSIDGKWEGIQTLVVSQRAVITPAASDLLRQKNIGVRRLKAGAAPAGASTAKRGLVLGVAETSFEPAVLIERLGRAGYKIEQLARTGIAALIAELADAAVKGGNAAVLLTGACELALCLANRGRGVRAAQATDRQSV